jgi:hypothetical protein
MIRRKHLEAAGLALGMVVILVLAFASSATTRRTTITGSVTYEGKPLEYGTISFIPTDGGVTSGGTVLEGRYSVANVSWGKNRVEIAAARPVKEKPDYDWWQEQVKIKQKAMAEWKRLRALGITDAKAIDAGMRKASGMPERLMPVDAVGNNQVVDVSPDLESLDFKLSSPPTK